MKAPYLFSALLVLLLFTQCRKRSIVELEAGFQITDPLRSSTKNAYNLEKTEAVSAPGSILPSDFKETIAKIVAPAREALLQAMEKDGTGTYIAFKEDVEQLKTLKSDDDKQEQLSRIRKYYYNFVHEAWEKAGIDEEHYKNAILRALPDTLRERIAFDAEFLNFRIEYSNRKDPLPSEKPDPSPAPLPAPELQCYNATKAIAGGSNKVITLAAGATANLFRYTGQPSSYYYLFANGVAFPLYGIGRGTCWANSNITIPGTFMADDKLIRIRKNFTWDATITAFAGGLVSCANGYYWSGTVFKHIEVWAPVIWFSELKRNEAIFEEEQADKSQLQVIRRGAEISNFAFTEGLGYANSTGSLTINNWTLCEELKK
jgi:hypothetical protein